jgi:hypothetical protein
VNYFLKEITQVEFGLSIQISTLWWAGSESNTRHKDFQSFALPTELPAHRHAIRALPHLFFSIKLLTGA